MKKTELQHIYLKDAKLWRAWLQKNHDRVVGVWLIYYKKHTGISRVPYNEAVEEALCFGWIDSIVKKIDEDRYMQKFTPRKPKSNWSLSNKKRVEKLLVLGKMTKAGQETLDVARQNGRWDETTESAINYELSEELLGLLRKNKIAFEYYLNLPHYLKNQYNNWIMSAKKPETRLKRCREMIRLLDSGKKPGLK